MRSTLLILILSGIALLMSAHWIHAQINYVQDKRILASDRRYGDSFGYSISVSGTFAIVGAHLREATSSGVGANFSALGAGAAYIYYQNKGGTNNWGQVKRLLASDRAYDDYFGFSVDIDGDIAIVGANQNSITGTREGSAYIFYRHRGGTNRWGQARRILAKDRADHDYFGVSVALHGDYVVVGAFGKDLGGDNKGAAYIFKKNQGGLDRWGQVKRLRASDRTDDDVFGSSVDIYGDFIIVGASGNDLTGYNDGAAYIFHRNKGGTNNWGQVKRLLATDRSDFDRFGSSVSIHGNYVIVGAPYNEITGSSEGAAYVFYKDKGGTNKWGQQRRILASDRADSDLFGFSVSITEDFAAVGAPYNDLGNPDQGAAYVFYRNQGGVNKWKQVKRLRATDGGFAEYFSQSIAIDGSLVLVGSPNNDIGGDRVGSAYAFRRLP